MSQKPVLYLTPLSQPVRSVLLTAAELGIELEERELDLFKGENKTPEFLEMNPQQTVPFLNDNGIMIADSHAICAYLSEKYGKTDSLYPKDLAKRALVDSRLHFDSGCLFARMRFLYEPIIYNGSMEMPDDRVQYIQSAWDILERFLKSSPFVCGDEMTIADLCLVASASSLTDIVPLDTLKHANIIEWIERLSKLPYYDSLNGVRGKMLQQLVSESLNKNAQNQIKKKLNFGNIYL